VGLVPNEGLGLENSQGHLVTLQYILTKEKVDIGIGVRLGANSRGYVDEICNLLSLENSILIHHI
jgi:hypothetical protein